MDYTAELLLSRLEKLRRTGEGRWMSLCPGHEDKGPSLSIRDTGGRMLIYCFAGCSAEDVLAAIGLTFSDLCPSKGAAYSQAIYQKKKLPPVTESEIDRLVQ